jgi:hypothetical protein
MNGKKKNNDDYIFWDEMWNHSDGEKVFDEDHALDIVLNTMVDEIDWNNDFDSTEEEKG